MRRLVTTRATSSVTTSSRAWRRTGAGRRSCGRRARASCASATRPLAPSGRFGPRWTACSSISRPPRPSWSPTGRTRTSMRRILKPCWRGIAAACGASRYRIATRSAPIPRRGGARRRSTSSSPADRQSPRPVVPILTLVQEMVIYGVSFDMVGKQPIVLLKAVDTNKFLPIWIGHPEAAAILMKLQGASTPRPMTHDLLFDMLGELEVACTRVSVTELRENTFYASITLSVNGREVEIDSRPSDALALAVRSGAPIFAAEDVIAESAIEFEHEVEDTEEVVDKFKEFLDHVTPEDFAGGDA